MKYIEKQKGNFPVIISVPHGGSLLPKNFKDRERGCFLKDDNLIPLLMAIKKELLTLGLTPYSIYSNIDRRKVDLNRSLVEAQESKKGKITWRLYHKTIDQYFDEILEKYKKGLYIDLHGQSTNDFIEIGYGQKDYSNFISRKFFGFWLEREGLSSFPSPSITQIKGRYRSGGYSLLSHRRRGIFSMQIEVNILARKSSKSIASFSEKFSKALISYMKDRGFI